MARPKKINIQFKDIQVIEPQKLWIFNVGWQVAEEKQQWEQDKSTMLHLLAELQDKGKLPNEWNDIREAIVDSHKNCAFAYQTRGAIRTARVLDVRHIITQLIS